MKPTRFSNHFSKEAETNQHISFYICLLEYANKAFLQYLGLVVIEFKKFEIIQFFEFFLKYFQKYN